MKTFQLEFRYQNRKGPEESTVKADASSLPRAIAKATREFVKGSDRKQRFMTQNGVVRVGVDKDTNRKSTRVT